MKTLKTMLFVVAAFIISAGLKAQDVISVADLKANMKDYVIVSCRKPADYKAKHIQGAINIYHNDLYNDGSVKSMIKSPAELAEIFGKAGISESSKIVLYDDGTGKYAGRVYWILKYMGATDVKILDGHIKAWMAMRGRTTMAATMAKKTTFTPSVKNEYLAKLADVKAGGAILVDVRSAEEYNGTDDGDLRKGHIPGAVHFLFSDVLDDKSMLKSNDQLKALFDAKGITKDKEVILYCASSVRAGIVFFALHSALGYSNVKVYDGAFYEWEADSNNPVEK